MNIQKVIVNIFSNWTNFVVSILVAYFVTPLIVHSLGNENYGIWTLIVSITGYFTVLDFGVNTAIVRYISMYVAKKENEKAREIYSTSFIFFTIIAVVIFLLTLLFAPYFKDFFNIETLSKKYLFYVFFLVGTNLAFSFMFSVYLATLSGLQEFFKINVVSIFIVLIKNAVIVIFLLNGFNLLSLAIIQIVLSFLKVFLQRQIIRKKYPFLKYSFQFFNKSSFKQISSYSIYSFIIAIALKILFFTDSLVIGKLISVSEITFYAIPGVIIEYVEKFVWTITAILIPVISSYDAVGNQDRNKEVYVFGSMYSFLLSIPVVFVLYTNGGNFISFWMGEEFGIRGLWVLRILVVGYTLSFPQMIAHGVLKGISKHKVYAYILLMEAGVNLLLSIILSGPFGIEGVAIGTAVPLIIVNIFIVPLYTCHVLNMAVTRYFFRAYAKPCILLITLAAFHFFLPIEVASLLELFIYSTGVVIFSLFCSVFFVIEQSHRKWVLDAAKKRFVWAGK